MRFGLVFDNVLWSKPVVSFPTNASANSFDKSLMYTEKNYLNQQINNYIIHCNQGKDKIVAEYLSKELNTGST